MHLRISLIMAVFPYKVFFACLV